MNQLCFNSVTFTIGFREPADHEPTDHAPADHEPANHAPTIKQLNYLIMIMNVNYSVCFLSQLLANAHI